MTHFGPFSMIVIGLGACGVGVLIVGEIGIIGKDVIVRAVSNWRMRHRIARKLK
jgi:hypothetical protein